MAEATFETACWQLFNAVEAIQKTLTSMENHPDVKGVEKYPYQFTCMLSSVHEAVVGLGTVNRSLAHAIAACNVKQERTVDVDKN